VDLQPDGRRSLVRRSWPIDVALGIAVVGVWVVAEGTVAAPSLWTVLSGVLVAVVTLLSLRAFHRWESWARPAWVELVVGSVIGCLVMPLIAVGVHDGWSLQAAAWVGPGTVVVVVLGVLVAAWISQVSTRGPTI
jgi:hypothetical protein